MTEIAMPRLSDSMQEGTILRWLKADGERVADGEELVEIETDKATMPYESPQAGIVTILAPEGSTLAVGQPIARVGAGAEVAAAVATEARSAPAAAHPAATPAASNGAGSTRAAHATPLARRIASHHGVDLRALHGSGPRGRITRADVAATAGVELAPPLGQPAAPSAVTPAPSVAVPPAAAADGGPATEVSAAKGTVTVEELTRLQQTIARRMAEAKATIPDFQVQTEVAMDAAIRLRRQLKQAGADPAPSLNDLIVKACAVALREHPRANGSYRDARFELHSRVNIGIAVAGQDALVVPTISDADERSLGSIAGESRRLAERVRAGSVTPPELAGATFTVSNLGMLGMTAITPVINPPQAAILGVGATRPTPALIDGQLADRQLLTLTLSCDHRMLYGADAARFLGRVRELLEQPLLLAL
jgi:pyruvate dehydrogenase E2 component (dihydrolipoamide acetyltransferase)